MPVHGFDQLNAKLSKLVSAITNKAPKLIAAGAERHFKESFRNQGFTDSSLQMWPKTKNGKPGRILKKTGLLMNSIRIARADINGIQIVAGGPHVPYARIHNEGGTIEGTVNVRQYVRRAHEVKARRRGARGSVAFSRRSVVVKAHKRNMLVYMAKRRYIGKSVVLERNSRGIVVRVIQEALR